MTSSADTYLPPVPQTGRAAAPADEAHDQNSLWSSLLARFRDLGGSFDTFANDANVHSDRFYRFMNEVPTLLLIGIVILAVVKPF